MTLRFGTDGVRGDADTDLTPALVQALGRAVAGGAIVLDPDAPREETMAALLAVPGIGPWTASYIAMRALSDADAQTPGDGFNFAPLTPLVKCP